MLISQDRVRNIAWTISSNGGPVSFLTDPLYFTDDSPGTPVRFIWPTHGTPNLCEVTIEGTWSPASASFIVGLLNVKGVKAFTRLEITLRRETTGVFDTTLTATLFDIMPGGNFGCWGTLENSLYQYDGIRVKILAANFLSPVPLAAGTVIDIGELWIGSSDYLPHQPGWTITTEDTSQFRDTENSQPSNVEGTVRRVLNFTTCLLRGMDETDLSIINIYQPLLYKLSRGRSVVCFPRWSSPDTPSVPAQEVMSQFGIFGSCRVIGGYKHVSADYFEPMPITCREYPTPSE